MLLSKKFTEPDVLSCVADLLQVLNLNPKRKRTSVSHPSRPSVEHPAVLNRAPSPPPSTSAADIPALLNLVPRPQCSIPHAELPVVSNVTPVPQPCTAPLQDDGPLKIHNRSVEEYQQIYHEVVDDMLRHVSDSFNQIMITFYGFFHI